MYKIVEFKNEPGDNRLFGLQKWEFDVSLGGYYSREYYKSPDNLEWSKPEYVRRHAMMSAAEAIKLYEQRDDTLPLEYEVISIEELKEIAEQEREQRSWYNRLKGLLVHR